jgi:PPOX class probable F420-dependent enzyme
MSSETPDVWTATATNALTPAELATHLDDSLGARLATNRPDGFPHLTPVWFIRDGTRVLFTLGERRRHLRNLRADPRATLLVDVDERHEPGSGEEVRAAMLSGEVQLSTDAGDVASWADRIDERYLGTTSDALAAEGYTLVILEPSLILSWDFSKS